MPITQISALGVFILRIQDFTIADNDLPTIGKTGANGRMWLLVKHRELIAYASQIVCSGNTRNACANHCCSHITPSLVLSFSIIAGS